MGIHAERSPMRLRRQGNVVSVSSVRQPWSVFFMSFSPAGVPHTRLPGWVTILLVVAIACLSAALVCAAREYFFQKQSSRPKPVMAMSSPPPAQAVSQVENSFSPESLSSKDLIQEGSLQPGPALPSTPEPAEPLPPDTKADILEVVVTFDDGPHVEEWGRGRNHTEKVIKRLEDNVIRKDIKAVFFVQTHAPGRGGTTSGREIIAAVAKRGHVIGIHTGSFADHASHRKRAIARPFDVNGNGVIDRGDGANGLESDMIQAKARISDLTGHIPAYVRPTYGERNDAVRAVYERQALKMILWDIDSGDNTGSPPVDSVNQNIHEGIERCIATGKSELIILFHDINSRTAENLEEYLANVCIAARKLGKTVVFPTSPDRIIEILNDKFYE